MRGSLADYLRDFGSGMPRKASGALPAASLAPDDDDLSLALAPPAPPAVDIEGITDEAYRRGRDEMARSLKAEHAAEMEALRAEHVRELERAKADAQREAAAAIEAGYRDAKASLATAIGRQVATALTPFLDEWMRESTVARLSRALSEAMADGETATVKVFGPESLFEPLRDALSDSGIAFDFSESEDIDLTVEFNGTIFATRLADWSDALKEALQ